MTAPPFTPSRAYPREEVARWDIETDVAIVGFGIAGACAAIEARAAGAAVTIFEVAAAAGGSSAMSGGEFYIGGGSATQKAAGFEDSVEDFRAYLTMAAGPGADQPRIDIYAEQGLAHLDWLAEQGVPFKGTYLPGRWPEPPTDDTLIWCGSEAAWPFRDVARPAPRGHTAQAFGRGGGAMVMERLIARALALGAEPHFSARALCLIADRAGAVHGLVVRIDGTARMVRARSGVILASGGFICNDDMVRQYAPRVSTVNPYPITAGNDDGSGIRMGQSVGAAVTHMEQFFATRTTFPPESLIKGILVNEQGQRFINEDAYHGRVAQYALRQSNGRVWMLLDDATFGRPESFPQVTIAAVGESWAEIEAELGLPVGELVHTMDAYNRNAAQGTDPLFHKQPEWLQPLTKAPFAALSACIPEWPAVVFTLGGLVTRPTGEVLDGAGSVIPGLYAAGRAACGVPRWGDGYSSGMSLGDASFFGRLAGKSAPAR
ncbi:MAG: FAD-dependent oxidoreductase [Sphingomonadales bacterium]|nr:FAD-dependent oxidoreductase [Sphingomonadales bacterium]